MARKRMFDLEIVDTDLFLEMPVSSQNLYFHLGMRADDDGFISNPKKIIRFIGACEDDLKILIAKKFIIQFENGLIVIRHWKINNYIRKDRYSETIYQSEKKRLKEAENGIYELLYPYGIPSVNQSVTNGLPSIVKNSVVENSIVECSSSIEQSDSCVDGSSQCERSDSCVDGFDNVINFYNNNIGLLTPYGLELLKDYAKDINSDAIIFALKLATEANQRNLKYIKAILDSWNKQGIKTLLQAQEENQSFKNKNQVNTVEETEEEKLVRKTKALEEAIRNANK